MSERNRGLMEGYLEMEAHITETGYPDWLTTGMDAMGEFEAESFTDYAAEARDKAVRAASKGEPVPGERFRVVRKPPQRD